MPTNQDNALKPVRFKWLRRNGSNLLMLGLFTVGIVVLYKLLHKIDVHQVRLQIHALAWSQIGLAALSTAAGYLALVGYDWSALRYIRKQLPLPLVAFTSFVGYALSNTIGASWLSGGAVRYRIYSRVGLTATEIALVIGFTTLGFGIGEVLIGGTALVVQPEIFAGYFGWPPDWVRWGGGVLLALFIAELILRSRHEGSVRWRKHEFRLPDTSILAGQMGFSVLDIGFAGTTLFLLLPDSTLGIAGFLAIFAVALVIGVLSHVPGGIGVFEAVMLTALTPFMPVEQVTAALVVYRLVYYLVPFLLGTVLLIAGELFVAMKTRQPLPEPVRERYQALAGALGGAAPFALSGMVFVAGALLLLGSSIPVAPATLQALDELFPVEIIELSHWFGGLFGAMLMLVSTALWKRVHAAVWVTSGLLVVGALVSLIQTLDYDRAIIMLLGLGLLYTTRGHFYRKSRLFAELRDVRWMLLTIAALAAFVALLFFSFKQTPYQHDLWWQFALGDQAPRGMRTAVIAGATFVFVYLWAGLKAPRYRPSLPRTEELEVAKRVIATQDNPDANFALTGDKALLFSADKQSFVMFGVHGNNWVSMGDPVAANEQDAVDLIWEFKSQATRSQDHAVFYHIRKDMMHHYIDADFTLLKLGEEALVPLADFSLEGSHRAKLRQARNRAARDGLRFEVVRPPHAASLLDKLQAISDVWLAEKGVREKGFSLGFFDRAYLNQCPLVLIHEADQVSAFANILVTETRQVATIDLMRHRPEANNGTMDYLFIELMLAMKAEGYRGFSLGMAPLSGLVERTGAPLWDRFGMLVYKRGKRFYNFEGLRRFKEKFEPVWEPRYLATTRRGLNPYVALADIGALTSGGFSGMFRK